MWLATVRRGVDDNITNHVSVVPVRAYASAGRYLKILWATGSTPYARRDDGLLAKTP